MATRDLKYFSWNHNPVTRKVQLVDKRVPEEITMSMAMADSFCRAMIGFKEDQRRHDKKVILDILHRRELVAKTRVTKLKNIIVNLKKVPNLF